MALIALEKVHKVFGTGETRVEALKGVDLAVAAGEFVAIVGSSGSGKTTLLDILGGLSRPTTGTYRFQAQDVGTLSEEALAGLRNRKIGFVFQTFHLLARQTAAQNVELPLFYAGLDRSQRVRRAREALESVGLGDRMHHTPAQLSGGQQQRVAIARALVNRPDVILADEPTGNLDSQSGMEILGLMKELHRSGHTILLITHDRDLAGRADRVVTLKDGRVVADQRPAPPAAVGAEEGSR